MVRLKTVDNWFLYNIWLGHTDLNLCCTGRNGLQVRSVGRFKNKYASHMISRNSNHVTSRHSWSSPAPDSPRIFLGALRVDFIDQSQSLFSPLDSVRFSWGPFRKLGLEQRACYRVTNYDIKLSFSLEQKIRVGRPTQHKIK